MKGRIVRSNNPKEFKVGKLYVHSTGMVVLCTSTTGLYDHSFSGMAMVDGYSHKTGEMSTGWMKSEYTLFTGTIELVQ